jgi:hypothetical protein
MPDLRQRPDADCAAIAGRRSARGGMPWGLSPSVHRIPRRRCSALRLEAAQRQVAGPAAAREARAHEAVLTP